MEDKHMSKNGTVTGTWKNRFQEIKCRLPVIIFEEDSNFIFYCPALDLSGYGVTEDEAYHSFDKVLVEYFRYTTKKGTLAKDLLRLGWTLKKSLKKKAIPPTLSSLLETNEDFSRIFNEYDFKKTETEISLPLIA
jgi:hypothetical protein